MKQKHSLLVIGGGGHGRVVMDAAILSKDFDRVVAVDPKAYQNWSFSWGKCVKEEADIPALAGEWGFVSAVGDATIRRMIFDLYVAKGFMPATVHHPSCIVSPSARLGQGCVILAGAIVGVDSTLGTGVIVNNGAIVEHDCSVRDFAHLAPGAVLAGGASLGEGSFLGANSSVRHRISVAANVIIGNSSAVVRDISSPGTYVGNPAKQLAAEAGVKE